MASSSATQQSMDFTHPPSGSPAGAAPILDKAATPLAQRIGGAPMSVAPPSQQPWARQRRDGWPRAVPAAASAASGALAPPSWPRPPSVASAAASSRRQGARAVLPLALRQVPARRRSARRCLDSTSTSFLLQLLGCPGRVPPVPRTPAPRSQVSAARPATPRRCGRRRRHGLLLHRLAFLDQGVEHLAALFLPWRGTQTGQPDLLGRRPAAGLRPAHDARPGKTLPPTVGSK